MKNKLTSLMPSAAIIGAVFMFILAIIGALTVGSYTARYLYAKKHGDVVVNSVFPGMTFKTTKGKIYEEINSYVYNYEFVVFDIRKNKKLYREAVSNKQDASKFESAHDNLVNELRNFSAKYDSAINNAIGVYGVHVDLYLKDYLKWKKAYEATVTDLTKTASEEENREVLKKAIELEKIVSFAAGIPDKSEVRETLTNSLIPIAEDIFKKHPNHPELCTVTAKKIDFDNIALTAEQNAFFNVGDKYCGEYYNKLSTWAFGGRDKYDFVMPKEKTKYDNLSYPEYYKKYIQPQILKIIKKVSLKENKELRREICWKGCLSSNASGARNPEADAKRYVYWEIEKDCSKEFPYLLDRNPYYGVLCVFSCFTIGGGVDCVERCKKTAGVLFNSSI